MKKNIHILASITIFGLYNTKSFHKQNQHNSNANEFNELATLRIIEETIDQYKKLSPEEKLELAQASDTSIEEMDLMMADFEKKVNEEMKKMEISKATQRIDNQKQTPIAQVQSESYQKKNNEEDKYEERKNALYIQINKIKEAAKILTSIAQKMSDLSFKNKILNTYPEALKNIDSCAYYLNITASYIKNAIESNKNLELMQKEINEIIEKAEIIKENLSELSQNISYEDKEENNIEDSIFIKYKIKRNSSQEEIKNTINKKIADIKNEINSIEKDSNIDEKNKKKLIMQKKFTLEEHEANLLKIEISKSSNNKNISTRKKHKKIIDKNQNEIIEKLQIIFDKTNTLQTLENFIQKTLPKEFEEGKAREKIIIQQTKEEEKIAKQRSSQGEIITENIRESNNYNDQEKHYQDYDSNNNYDNYDSDYNNQNNEQESHEKSNEPKTIAGGPSKNKAGSTGTQKKVAKEIQKGSYTKKNTDKKTEEEKIKNTEKIIELINEIDELDNKLEKKQESEKTKKNQEKINKINKQIENKTKELLNTIKKLTEEDCEELIEVKKSQDEILTEIKTIQEKTGNKDIIPDIEKTKKITSMEYSYLLMKNKPHLFEIPMETIITKITDIDETPKWYTLLQKQEEKK
jgi:hypothetical protein